MEEHLRWLNEELFAQSFVGGVCQCETARATKRSTDPFRLAAVFFSYAFLDQFIYTHYRNSHSEFKQRFPGPKLAAHGSGGHASPSWMLFSKGNGISNMEAGELAETFIEVMSGGLAWLQESSGASNAQLSDVFEREIENQMPQLFAAYVARSQQV